MRCLVPPRPPPPPPPPPPGPPLRPFLLQGGLTEAERVVSAASTLDAAVLTAKVGVLFFVFSEAGVCKGPWGARQQGQRAPTGAQPPFLNAAPASGCSQGARYNLAVCSALQVGVVAAAAKTAYDVFAALPDAARVAGMAGGLVLAALVTRAVLKATQSGPAGQPVAPAAAAATPAAPAAAPAPEAVPGADGSAAEDAGDGRLSAADLVSAAGMVPEQGRPLE